MLKQRVITALVMMLVLLPALFYPSSIPFCGIAVVMIAAAAWEWGRLAGYGSVASFGVGAACAAMSLAAWYAGWLDHKMPLLWGAVGGLWVLLGAGMLHGGVAAWSALPRPVRLLGGLLALWLAWLAVAQARVIGVNFLLSVMSLVWVADIFAYFAGRAWGGRFSRTKLAPTISPGKSWEGVWGGMVGVLILAGVWLWADVASGAAVPSLYSLVYGRAWWLLPIAVLFMAAMSVVGDLVESLIKRSAGVKDSSGLLPGHGGVLDRLDALLPTLPLAMMLHSSL
ncbi:phosphatidate cytidylyltransferase [Rhodoferax sp.]|uniref:phosphatidate cytidylyltransferase n=1 Tax=Rhodoferax sp. TaxID=50421 RepID=UPI002743746B|nr:phosphatidate cytidylyltransferase [Rhodoferax sp.]